MKRLALVMTPFLVLMLILGTIGCAEKKTTPTPGPTSTPAATPTARLTTAPTPTAAAPVKPTGELKAALSYIEGPPSTDPLGFGIASKTHLFIMYDYLVGATPGGELSTQTGIANKWEHSADYVTWTFYLREGVKFHNGDDLTAEDVKFSLGQMGLPGVIQTFAREIFANFQEIVVESPYKLTVRLKRPAFFFDYQMSPITGTNGMIRPKKYTEANGLDYFRQHPIGSGPYRFASIQSGASITYEAMDSHFSLGVPKYKTIVLYKVPEDITRVAMLKSGDADIIDTSRELTSSLQKDGFNIIQSQISDAVTLTFESHHGPSNPLSDKRVREAIVLAVDKEDILKNLFKGQGEIVADQNTYPYVLGSVPNLPIRPYDPERAKALLKEAGYPEKFAEPELTFYSFTLTGVPEMTAVVEAMVGYWIKVGLKVKIVPTDYATIRGAVVAKTNRNAIWANAAEPSKLTAASLAIGRTSPPGSYAMYTDPPDPAHDALLDEQAAAKTPEEFLAASSKILKYRYDVNWSPAFMAVKRVYATSKKIAKWDLGLYYWDRLNLRSLVTR